MSHKRKRSSEDGEDLSSLSSYVLSGSSKRRPGESSSSAAASSSSAASSISSPFSTTNTSSSSCTCSVVNRGFMQKLADLIWSSKVSEWKNNLPEGPNIVARYHRNNNRLWVGQRSPGRKLPNILKLTYQEEKTANKQWILENMCILYECNDVIWVLNVIELGRQIASTKGVIMNPINGTLFSSNDIRRFEAEYEKNVFRIENPQLIKQLSYQCTNMICSVTGFNKADPAEIANLKKAANILTLVLKGLRYVDPENILITIAYGTIQTINTLTQHSDIAERLLKGQGTQSDLDILMNTFGLKMSGDMLKPSEGDPISKFIIGQAINKSTELSSRILESVYKEHRRHGGNQCKMSDEQYRLYMEYQKMVDLAIPLLKN